MMAEQNRFAAAGRRGGLAGGKKGGRNRMAGLSEDERSELAKTAAAARWQDGRPEVHQVVRMMVEAITRGGGMRRLYVMGKTAWHAECGHLEEDRWMKWCVGTYGEGATFSAVIEDVVA